MSSPQLETLAQDTIRAAIRRIISDGAPFTLVDSPPGAGKTWFVEQLTAVASRHAHLRVLVATPRVEQAYDLIRRVGCYALPSIQILMAAQRQPPVDVATVGRWCNSKNILSGPGVVISTAHKLAASIEDIPANSFDILIVDEAYQLAAKDFYPISSLADRVVLVGDPGQLDPLVTIDTASFEAKPNKIHWSAPNTIRDRYPGLDVIRLPASRRLRADTVHMVQPAFYPNLPFDSLVDESSRRIQSSVSGTGDAIDSAIDRIACGDSIVTVLLPAEQAAFEEFDSAISQAMANITTRLFERLTKIDGREITVDDVGCIDSHVASGEAVAVRLRERGLGDVFVNTPEQWQGLERPITIVKHPLCEASALSEFSLDPGRWCVALSRHTHASIIVARASIDSQLSDYVHDCSTTPAGGRDYVWRGYRAHRAIWQSLQERDRLFQ